MPIPAVLIIAGLAVAYVAVVVLPTAGRRRRDQPSEPIAPRTPLDDVAPTGRDDFAPDLPELPDVG